jgi:hypothetical protein
MNDKEIAQDPMTPLEKLEELAKNESKIVRMMTAKNPSLSKELFTLLSKDESSSVRTEIADNLKTPPEVLNNMWDTKWTIEQYYILNNPNTPESAKEKMIEKYLQHEPEFAKDLSFDKFKKLTVHKRDYYYRLNALRDAMNNKNAKKDLLQKALVFEEWLFEYGDKIIGKVLCKDDDIYQMKEKEIKETAKKSLSILELCKK